MVIVAKSDDILILLLGLSLMRAKPLRATKPPVFSLCRGLTNPHIPSAMSQDEDFAALESRVFASVVSAVRAVSALGAHDIPFQRSSDADFADAADDTAARVLALANGLLAGAAPAPIAPLASEDDVEQRWRDIVDVADHLLERADVCLDEASGAIKPPPPQPQPAAASKVRMQPAKQIYVVAG